MRSSGSAGGPSGSSSHAAWRVPTMCIRLRSRTTVYESLMEEDDIMSSSQDDFVLRLYVAGQTPKCLRAFANLKRICEEYLTNRYRIEMIDLLLDPALARGDQILAVPTLVRRMPEPVRKIIGDLSNTQRVLAGLDVSVGAA